MPLSLLCSSILGSTCSSTTFVPLYLSLLSCPVCPSVRYCSWARAIGVWDMAVNFEARRPLDTYRPMKLKALVCAKFFHVFVHCHYVLGGVLEWTESLGNLEEMKGTDSIGTTGIWAW